MAGYVPTDLFEQLGADNRWKKWLEEQKTAQIRHLAAAGEQVGMFRSQGRLGLLLEMEALSMKK